MDRSSNDGISILFTKSHEIGTNRLHVMYKIRMDVEMKRILYSNLKLEWNLKQIRTERN